MNLNWILLLFYFPLIHGEKEDICIIRSRDGHTNEEETITQTDCERYDKWLNNNQSTIQIIDVDGTIAGCWLFETKTTETIYFNTNLNPSGMCSAPHYCVQYVDCSSSDDGVEKMYVAPTTTPTSTPTTADGIEVSDIDESTTPSRDEDPEYPTHQILLIATIILVTISSMFFLIAIRTRTKANILYR